MQAGTGLIKQTLHTRRRSIEYFVPDPVQIHRQWQRRHGAEIPYWSQVWPAATALSLHIDAHSQLVTNQSVLELGAGIGLPALTAAAYAKQTCCSDAAADALPYMELNALHNNCLQFSACHINWNNAAELPACDVLLLSDVAYDPQQFVPLQKMLRKYLHKKTRILLSIPQRRVSAGFLDVLPATPVSTTTYSIPHCETQVQVQVLLLQ
ncbi:MAG: class I SAM-dependent methyltransferase [Lacibacter sp.]|jgi:predicted nicotinamide N-methyase